jgi:peroxiredoxin
MDERLHLRDRRAFLIVAAACAVVAGCGGVSEGEGLSAASPRRAPIARLDALGGEASDLVSLTRGRVALVSFWATWCAACEREQGALNRLDAAARRRSDAIVVGVAVGETRATVEAFARRRGLSYVQLADEDFRLADALGQRRVPATFVVDRDARVVFRGDALDAEAVDAFRSLLGPGGARTDSAESERRLTAPSSTRGSASRRSPRSTA